MFHSELDFFSPFSNNKKSFNKDKAYFHSIVKKEGTIWYYSGKRRRQKRI